jgi:hypothetical protein
LHTPDAQSLPAPQPVPSEHVGEQAGAAHVVFVQTPDPQSPLAPHAAPTAQVGAHAGAPQVPPVQTPEAQFPDVVQTFPSGQVGEHVGLQEPSVQVSPVPQVVPFATGLHPVVLVPGSQLSHALTVSRVPLA